VTEDVAQRILGAIAAERLLIFCGAGLSMSPPSSLPSAKDVAEFCATESFQKTGEVLPPALATDLEALAKHFDSKHTFETLFLKALVPWWRFNRDPNDGHLAVADFLATGVLLAGLTTNFDVLVEKAARRLGEPDFRPTIDQHDFGAKAEHAEYLKLHGCMDRNRYETIWFREQLANPNIAKRITLFGDWLKANILNRDLLLVGFWSDWAYLNQILTDKLGVGLPQHVYVVDPETAAGLQAKAPSLWAWANQSTISFHHIQEKGNEFLDELRRRWSALFLYSVTQSATADHQSLFGCAPAVTPATYLGFSSSDLYALRRDITGTPRTLPTRARQPDPGFHIASAIHARLLAKGAIYKEHVYRLNGKTTRVVNGHGRVLSAVKAQFRDEPPGLHVETIVAASARQDSSPSSVVRSTAAPSIVRPGSTAHWTTERELVLDLGGVGGV
jgi:NAD-dependent SIR2 family protein deacetylase